MVIIGKQIFGIEPNDSKINKLMRKFDPEYVELYTFGILKEVHQTTAGIFGMSLETAQEIYKGKAVYVCPD